jgi:type I restriction enzyme, S subunit
MKVNDINSINSPTLRFPEFTESWDVREIGEFIQERSEYATSNLPLFSLTIENGVVPKSKRYERSFLVKGKDNAYKKMEPYDFAFNPMNLRFGALAQYKGSENVAVSKYYNIFHGKGGCATDYLEIFLTTYKMIQFYDKMSTGTLEEKKRVHYLDFIHFKKLFPSLPEQKKISTFLFAVEKKIKQLQRKKELLEQYKKGVMQKIFSQEIRFKNENGNDYPDWEERRLGDVTECLDNKRIPLNQAERANKKGAYPYWGANNVMDSIDEYIFDETIVLLAEDGGYFDEFQTRPIAQISYGKCWVNNHAHVLRGNNELVNEFLYFSLVHKNILGYVNVGTRAKLNKSDMLMIPMTIPCVDEQEKISTFMGSIDRLISRTNIDNELTRKFKKGLLQQMFV